MDTAPPPTLMYATIGRPAAASSYRAMRRSTASSRVPSGKRSSSLRSAASSSKRRPASESPTALSSTPPRLAATDTVRSEEHTSELQSRENLVCRLLLEKKKILLDCRQNV